MAVLCLVSERTSTVRPRIVTICYNPSTWAELVGANPEAAVCHSLLSRSTHDDVEPMDGDNTISLLSVCEC